MAEPTPLMLPHVEEWLKAQPDTSIVGFSQMPCECVVANCWLETIGAEEVEVIDAAEEDSDVDHAYYIIVRDYDDDDEETEVVYLPTTGIIDFVRELDEAVPDGEPVTKEQALAVIQAIYDQFETEDERPI